MKERFPPTWNKTVTVFNRCKAQDNDTKKDTWHKTVLHGVFFSQQTTRIVDGQSVKFAQTNICRIPFTTEYRPYLQWKANKRGFTLSLGDILILGEVSETMTPENRLDILNKYKPDAFSAELIKDNAAPGLSLRHWKVEGNYEHRR